MPVNLTPSDVTGFPVSRPVQAGSKVGSFYPVEVTFGGTDEIIPIALGRMPSGYQVYRNGPGGVVYDAADGAASWSPSQIVLHATLPGTYGILVF